MPAVSKKQQKFFGIVRSIQKGDAPASKFSKSAQKAAKTMKKIDVKDFADTDGEDLPTKVKKEERDYKAEYKKFQSSPKMKKYRAELNQYNRKRGTYGNGDGKDASHKGGKIAGFEKESTNRGRAEKSRLKKEGKEFTDRQLASRIAYHANLHKGTGVGYANAFAQIGMFLRDIGYKKSFIEAVKVMKVLAKKKRVESVNEAKPKLQSFKFKFKCMECGKSFIKSLRRSLEVKCPKCKSVDIELENVNVSGEIIKEARDEKVYLLNGMLWLSHSPNSGETTRVRGRGFITDKRGDKNYDSSVSKFAKWASKNKPIKKKRTKTGSRLSLFKIGEYSRSDGDAKQYDIWGGEVKPRKWWYLLVSQGKINVITIFDSKGEAMSWIGHSEDVSVDENLLFGESVNEIDFGKKLQKNVDKYSKRAKQSKASVKKQIDMSALRKEISKLEKRWIGAQQKMKSAARRGDTKMANKWKGTARKAAAEMNKVQDKINAARKKESVNEAAIGKVGIGFFIDQLTNAMDHYNEREFVSHLNRELEIDKKVLKRVWKNYLKVSPRYKTKWLPRNWEKWLERQGIVESVNEGADYSKVPTKKLVKTYKQMADERLSSSAALTFRLIAKELIKRKAKLEGTCGYAPEGKVDVHNTDKLTPAGPHLLKKQKKKVESMNEKVIKVSKKDNIPGNPMKMKGEEKIKKLVYSGSIKNKGSYEIKGNKLNVNNIRPRDKGFFVRHFTMGTGFRKANLYYDGVHWQGKKEF